MSVFAKCIKCSMWLGRWFPVLFLISLLSWSYYSYIILMCICKLIPFFDLMSICWLKILNEIFFKFTFKNGLNDVSNQAFCFIFVIHQIIGQIIILLTKRFLHNFLSLFLEYLSLVLLPSRIHRSRQSWRRSKNLRFYLTNNYLNESNL